MDSKYFSNNNILYTFHLEYMESKLYWVDFIKSKDLGIICLSYLNHKYEIKDEKKWLLAKIKYGF